MSKRIDANGNRTKPHVCGKNCIHRRIEEVGQEVKVLEELIAEGIAEGYDD